MHRRKQKRNTIDQRVDTQSDPASRRSLNIPLALGSLALVVVVFTALYFWHAFQAKKVAQTLLAQANALEEESDFSAAASYLFRYTRLQPDDTDAMTRLAQVYDQSVKNRDQMGRAIELYYQALGVAKPDEQFGLRRSLTKLLIKQQRFYEAETEANALLAQLGGGSEAADQSPDNDTKHFDAARLLALAIYGRYKTNSDQTAIGPGTGQLREAESEVQRGSISAALVPALRNALALKMDPQLAGVLATIYRDEANLSIWNADVKEEDQEQANRLTAIEKNQAAEHLMDELVQGNPNDPVAWLVRFSYRVKYELPGAFEDLNSALKLAPDNLAVQLAAGHYERSLAAKRATGEDSANTQQGTIADPSTLGTTPSSSVTISTEARAHLTKSADHYRYIIEKIDAKNETAYVGWGMVTAALGDESEAVSIWRRGLDAINEGSLLIDWQLAELLLANDDLTGEEVVIRRIEEQLNRLESRSNRQSIAPLKRSFALMQAQWLASQKQYSDAIPLLVSVTAGPATSENEIAEKYQASLLIASCYKALELWDQAATAYENAGAIRKQESVPCVLAASVWETVGAVDNAIALYRRALVLGASPITNMHLARTLLEKQRAVPAAARDWSEFETVLQKAQAIDNSTERFPERWRIDLLEAEYRLVRASEQDQRDEGVKQALEIARAAETQHMDSVPLMESLVALYEELGCTADADRALQRFDDLTPDETQTCILRSKLLVQRKQFDAARQLLDSRAATASHGEVALLNKMSARIALLQDDVKAANQILEQLWEDHPEDLTIAQMRAETAMEQKDFEAARVWESRFSKNVPGDRSAASCFKVRRLLAESPTLGEPARDAKLREAASELNRLKTVRPNWSVTHFLEGQLEQRRGRFPQAVEAYQRAMSLGDRRLAVYEGLLTALYQNNDVKRASEYLAELGDSIDSSSQLTTVAINVAVQLNEPQRGVEVARRAAVQRPDDVMARIWYGQMLLLNAQNEEAEAALREATKLAPQDPRTWNALFAAYVRTGKPDEARKTLQEMADNATLTDAQQAFVLAQGYESLADREKAEKLYLDAAKKDPENIPIKMRLAFFYQEGHRDRAIALLEDVLRLEPHHGEARRTLAALLAAQGGDLQWQRACELLQESQADGDSRFPDRRLQAVLLSRRGGPENLALAREILEEFVDSNAVVPADRLLLARLWEQAGDVRAARAQYRALVAPSSVDAKSIAAYVDFLLRHIDLENAQLWLDKLRAKSTGAIDLELLQLQSRLLFAQKKSSEIVKLVDPAAEQFLASIPDNDPAQRTRFVAAVAALYRQCEQYSVAEKWCRQLRQLDPKQFAPLAFCLAHQHRVDEAIDLCIEAAQVFDTAVPAVVLSSVLSLGGASTSDFERAEPTLQTAQRKYGNNADVLLALSNARVVQGRIEDAIPLLQEAVELDPKNVVALNNLATILSEQPTLRAKALEYIDRAIAITGPRADLYDTKGTIYVYENRATEALPFLEFAASSADADPRYQFHLAAAYKEVGQMEKAARSFKQSVDRKLTGQYMTERDHQLFSEMQDLFQQAP